MTDVAEEMRLAKQAEGRAIREEAANRRAGTAAAKHVWILITEFGDGLVSTGEHLDGAGDLTHEAGDRIRVPEDVATALRKRGFAQLDQNQDAPPAPVVAQVEPPPPEKPAAADAGKPEKAPGDKGADDKKADA